MNIFNNLPQSDFPWTSTAHKFMQDAMLLLEKMYALGGDDYILTGCESQGDSSYAPGIMVLNGKLVNFVGGTEQSYVKLVETITNITVGSGTRQTTTYSAEFGTGTGYQVLWSTLDNARINLRNLGHVKKPLSLTGTGVATSTEATVTTNSTYKRQESFGFIHKEMMLEFTAGVTQDIISFDLSLSVDIDNMLDATEAVPVVVRNIANDLVYQGAAFISTAGTLVVKLIDGISMVSGETYRVKIQVTDG